LPKLWLNTSARRTSGSDAINGETDPQLLARIDRLRRLHGGSRLRAASCRDLEESRQVMRAGYFVGVLMTFCSGL
jgi:hypothetical protein